MSALVTIGYPDEQVADEVLRTLDELMVRSDALQVQDAVVVLRREDGQVDVRPKIHQGALEIGAGALLGGLIGGLLFAPLLGAALGAAAGATRAALTDLGIPDDYFDQLGQALPVGGTALIVLAEVRNPDAVRAALAEHGGRVLLTSLTEAGEQQLRRALRGDGGQV